MSLELRNAFQSTGEPVLSLMRDAAKRAIMPRWRSLRAEDVRRKSAGELVSITDLECEAILTEGLARLLPEATVLGEEAIAAEPSLTSRLGDELCWIIDPLDGTANFVSGDGPFGTMIALAERGLPVAGWIYDPVRDRSCHAMLEEGAWIDGARVSTSPSKSQRPVLAVSSLFGDAEHRIALKQELNMNYRVVELPRCAAEQYPRLALGENDLTLFGRTLAWDHAAGVLFLTEAGGRVARIDGSPYRVDDQRSGLIAASNPAEWDGLADALNRMGETFGRP